MFYLICDINLENVVTSLLHKIYECKYIKDFGNRRCLKTLTKQSLYESVFFLNIPLTLLQILWITSLQIDPMSIPSSRRMNLITNVFFLPSVAFKAICQNMIGMVPARVNQPSSHWEFGAHYRRKICWHFKVTKIYKFIREIGKINMLAYLDDEDLRIIQGKYAKPKKASIYCLQVSML